MAKFVFIIEDKNPALLTKDLYYSHIEYLKRNSAAGRLFLVGPLKGDKLLQIIDADSAEEASAIVRGDPYVRGRHYQSFRLYELTESNAANNWLMDTPRIQEMLRGLE